MKDVFFTGATGGLGMLCVKELSRRGWRVFASGTNEEKLKQLAGLENIIPVKADITDDDSLAAAWRLVRGYTDKLDAVANFAGLSSFTSMVEGDPAPVTELLFKVNVMGPVKVNRMFIDMLLKGKGRIINCSSEAGWLKAQPFAAPYFMSKRALEAYNDCLRRELMFLGIPVVKIQPGPFGTSMTSGVMNDYRATLAGTKHYERVLVKLRALLGLGLKQYCGTDKLVRKVVHALEDTPPKLTYRVGVSKLLLLLEILPDRTVDRLYLKLMSMA